ncbi:major facilitator superfamily domain-containing protein [Rhexocercosporidium sp. MPI-PUGE-AT-0058]|nr:major facilitator superfamily domain-containing protein [Rhexocercosporidium sp. MPI-PUGE-AT-0058]
MSSTNLSGWITIEHQDVSAEQPERGQISAGAVSLPVLTHPLDIEMNEIPQRDVHGDLVASDVETSSPSPNIRVESRLSEAAVHGSDEMQTIWEPYKNRFRVLASCFMALSNGMNDSAPGALIESIERKYNIDYGTVSIIFVCNAIGFVTAAFFLSALSRRIGQAKCLVISELLLIIGYVGLVATPPFPIVCASFFFLGIGMSINLAICQVFCANLANNTALLGAYQGAYGIGGTIGPIIATALVSNGYVWSRYYFILLGIAVFNCCFAPWSFWDHERESDISISNVQSTAGTQSSTQRNFKSFRTLMSHKPTVLGALFIFAYQGAEVAISGWIISFLVQFRNGDPSKVGYVTSGFWAGITLGRFTLSFLAHKTGERPFVFAVTAGALILELLIWFVPSIIGNSVAVAFSGFLLGPVSPAAIHIFQRLIPRHMQISSLSVIGSIGTSGGAVAPFMTGMIAQQVGTFVLHPICIGLFVCMAATWWMIPKVDKRSE